MEENDETIKAGEVVLLSRGEYSDYQVTSLIRATKNFKPISLKEEWVKLNPDSVKEYGTDLSAFESWLINTKNVAEEIKHRELHIGSYSMLDPSVR